MKTRLIIKLIFLAISMHTINLHSAKTYDDYVYFAGDLNLICSRASLKSNVIFGRFYFGANVSHNLYNLFSPNTEKRISLLNNKVYDVLGVSILGSTGTKIHFSSGFCFDQRASNTEELDYRSSTENDGNYYIERWRTKDVPSVIRNLALFEIWYSPIIGKKFIPCYNEDSHDKLKYFIPFEYDIYYNVSYRWERQINVTDYYGNRYFNAGITTNREFTKIGAFIDGGVGVGPVKGIAPRDWNSKYTRWNATYELGFLTYIKLPNNYKNFDHFQPTVIYFNVGISFGIIGF